MKAQMRAAMTALYDGLHEFNRVLAPKVTDALRKAGGSSPVLAVAFTDDGAVFVKATATFRGVHSVSDLDDAAEAVGVAAGATNAVDWEEEDASSYAFYFTEPLYRTV